MTEYVDIFDAALKHIGVKSRAEAHRDGDWHQVFHCWVVGREADGEQFVVLQKRGPQQDTYPDKIDVSVGGHLEAGETARDGIRELEEELGLSARYEDLVPLGRLRGVQRYGESIDRQIYHIFLYECDQDLSAYRYCKAELAGLVKVPLDAGIRLLSGEADAISAAAVGLGMRSITITRADFVPSADDYARKALLLAQRYFNGESSLSCFSLHTLGATDNEEQSHD